MCRSIIVQSFTGEQKFTTLLMINKIFFKDVRKVMNENKLVNY